MRNKKNAEKYLRFINSPLWLTKPKYYLKSKINKRISCTFVFHIKNT
jgi:hypothetical protein